MAVTARLDLKVKDDWESVPLHSHVQAGTVDGESVVVYDILVAVSERDPFLLASPRQCRAVAERHAHLLYLLSPSWVAPVHPNPTPPSVRRHVPCAHWVPAWGYLETSRCCDTRPLLSIGRHTRTRGARAAPAGHRRHAAQGVHDHGGRFVRAHGNVDCRAAGCRHGSVQVRTPLPLRAPRQEILISKSLSPARVHSGWTGARNRTSVLLAGRRRTRSRPWVHAAVHLLPAAKATRTIWVSAGLARRVHSGTKNALQMPCGNCSGSRAG